jgi:hypothetical protein
MHRELALYFTACQLIKDVCNNPDISQTLDRRMQALSLTPSFSWVKIGTERVVTVSTVSTACGKPLKRFFVSTRFHTQLKLGVNEKTPA